MVKRVNWAKITFKNLIYFVIFHSLWQSILHIKKIHSCKHIKLYVSNKIRLTQEMCWSQPIIYLAIWFNYKCYCRFLQVFCNDMISFDDFNSLYLILTHVLVKAALFVTLLINSKIVHMVLSGLPSVWYVCMKNESRNSMWLFLII